MRDLSRSLRSSGTPVPVPWKHLEALIHPRTKDFMVVGAHEGVGKSTFALDWLIETGIHSLYVSLDTTLADHAIRVIAMSSGHDIQTLVRSYDRNRDEWLDAWTPYLEGLPFKARFVDRSMGARTIGEVVIAETEYWGEPPLLTVVDNVGDLVEKEESAAEYGRIFRELHQVARENETCVMGLHHLRRKPPSVGQKDEDDPMLKPVHLHDFLYAGGRAVQFALGLWRPHSDTMRVGVLKNRMGPASSSGRLFAELGFDPAHARLSNMDLIQPSVASTFRKKE